MLTTQWNDLGVSVLQVQFQVHNLRTYVCKPTINVKLWFNTTIMTHIGVFWNPFTVWGGKPWLPYESSDTQHWGFFLWRCVHSPVVLYLFPPYGRRCWDVGHCARGCVAEDHSCQRETLTSSETLYTKHVIWPSALLFGVLEEKSVSYLSVSPVHVIAILCGGLDQIPQFSFGCKHYHSLFMQFCQLCRSQDLFACGGFVVLRVPEETWWCLLHVLLCHVLWSSHCLAYLW